MGFVVSAAQEISVVMASLLLALALYSLAAKAMGRLGCPQATGLFLGYMSVIGLFALPAGSLLTLALAYAGGGAIAIWLGRLLFVPQPAMAPADVRA